MVMTILGFLCALALSPLLTVNAGAGKYVKVKGSITSVMVAGEVKKMVVEDKEGRHLVIYADETTKVIRNGKKADFSDLQKGEEVKVKHDGMRYAKKIKVIGQ